ncbi:hypothetical protein TNCV_2689351 [Trichonephila clavipes]|nr:hypothetical protein TNCV_2689351 [Trichonephila clavipes]
MEVVDPQEGTLVTRVHPGVTAPQKKPHAPPITIDNVKNQVALLKLLQDVTKQKLEAKLIGTKTPNRHVTHADHCRPCGAQGYSIKECHNMQSRKTNSSLYALHGKYRKS